MIFRRSNDLKSMLDSVRGYISSFSKDKDDKKRVDKILEAMKFVDRIFFVESAPQAYHDTAIPLTDNQTISQPSTVARMLFLAKLYPNLDFLEIGSGSGWNATLLAYLVYPGKVLSLERIKNLHKLSKENHKRFIDSLEKDKEKFKNIEFRWSNVFEMINESDEKFDRIMLTAGISKNSEEKIELLANKFLKERGILVCPYMSGPMIIMKKIDKKIKIEYTSEYYSFVPLVE